MNFHDITKQNIRDNFVSEFLLSSTCVRACVSACVCVCVCTLEDNEFWFRAKVYL